MRRLILILIVSLFSAIYCVPASAANNEALINEIELNPIGTDSSAEHPIIIIQSEPSLPGNSTIEAAAVTPAIQPSQNLTMAFIDVGQGDSILIILPNTRTLLIDGGYYEDSGKVLATLQEHGLSRIDVMVATHPQGDHIAGLVDVINNVDVGQVLHSGRSRQGHPSSEALLDAIETKQIPLNSVREGDSINLDPTVKIDVLNPPSNLTDAINNNSVVLKLTYGEFSALFTGDIGEPSEARLVSENCTPLDADVLKAGHHGNRESSISPFLNAVTPEVVIISLGLGFGYPHYEALERISAAGTEHVFRTDLDGTITLTADGSSEYSIVTENNEKTVVDTPRSETTIC